MNTGKKKSLTCSPSIRFSLCYFCFAGAMKKNIIRAFKLGCLWFNSNSIGCTLFLPKIPTASDLVKQKCGIMGGSQGLWLIYKQLFATVRTKANQSCINGV